MSAPTIRKQFFGWQCRVRKYAITQNNGRPTEGMCPRIIIEDKNGSRQDLGSTIVFITHENPEKITAEFRHAYHKTQEPLARVETALKLLATEYYRQGLNFSEEITALYYGDSKLVTKVLAVNHCILNFEQNNQQFHIPCSVQDLPEENPYYQTTYWHNKLFNPNIPAGIAVLSYRPEWENAIAEPAIEMS